MPNEGERVAIHPSALLAVKIGSALVWAANSGDCISLLTFLNKKSIVSASAPITLLQMAIKRSYPGVARYLLDRGAKVDAEGPAGAIHCSVEKRERHRGPAAPS